MEMQFDKATYKSLHKVLSRTLDQELTQEIRLPESLPDIGRVLGCWGQVTVRSKEWYTGSVGVTGGVMAWVLYVPEDDSEAKSVEAWLPFQTQWDIPESQRDGTVCVIPFIKSIDARSVSARKMMLRANVSVQGKAFEPKETMICQAKQLPDDIQMLNQTYQLEIPVEAGEKSLQLEETLLQSSDLQNAEKVCYYDLKPQITETRILGDKLLFRGKANFHMVYIGEDHGCKSFDQELSFSQYAHLDNEHTANPNAWTCPIVTSVELDFTSEQPMIKAGVSVQYIIYERTTMEIVEDAYSTVYNIESDKQTVQVYSKLDTLDKSLELTQNFSANVKDIVDVVCYPGHPENIQNGEMTEVVESVLMQVLYSDTEGNLQGTVVSGKQSWEFASDPHNQTDVEVVCITKPQFTYNGENVVVTVSAQLQADVCSDNNLPMISAIEIKEPKELDPTRPSLILRKLGSCRVWDIAKQYGAKVSDIQSVNNLDNPDANQVLLIPIT